MKTTNWAEVNITYNQNNKLSLNKQYPGIDEETEPELPKKKKKKTRNRKQSTEHEWRAPMVKKPADNSTHSWENQLKKLKKKPRNEK